VPILEQLLAAMAANPADAFTQEQGCEAIRNLVVDSDSCQAVAERGGVGRVVAAMRLHPDSSGVQGHCSGTLTHLANSPLARQQIAEGGLQAAIAAMARHGGSELVQYKGCALLANFCTSDEEQALAAAAGAVPAALGAMRLHAGAGRVQDHCFGALYNLARHAGSRASISSSGGVQAVQRAMQAHPESDTVRAVGKELLRLLWADSAERSLPD